ncbi:glycosyltransferase [Paludisphaera soli]|uniref:glycosyltransferase n=1 Tax=Paludisphaera soli TaxID=2712865 RepID=UPI0013E9B494|nr:glycosyltransferase [Paludisphaera soli]
MTTSAPGSVEASRPVRGGRAGRGEAGRPIRVCYLIDRLRVGGTETQLLSLIRHLDPSVLQPYLCLLDGEDETSRALEPRGCPVTRLGVRSIRSVRGLTRCGIFARQLRREHIDVLQVYFRDSAIFGAVAGRLAGVPRVVRVRNNLGYWMTPGDRRTFRVVNRLITTTFTNSEAGLQALVEQEGLAPGSITVVDNGIDLDRYDRPRPVRPRGGATPRQVGVVANLRAVKGLDVFLRAAATVAAKHEDVRFTIAGEGPERASLAGLVDELGLADRVRMPGQVDDVPGFLADLDLAVHSSSSEGLSNAVLESLAAGLPTIATAVGANPSLIRDGFNGLLVPAGEPARLAAAMDRLLSDPAAAGAMGRAARRSVGDRFSWPNVARAYEGLYGRIMGV